MHSVRATSRCVLCLNAFLRFQGFLSRCLGFLCGVWVTSASADTPGTPDPSFIPNELQVRALAVQPDGRVLVGAYELLRLMQDGSRDTGFRASATTAGSSPPVLAVAVQQDGGVIVGGRFTSIAGRSQPFLARFLAHGTPDSLFSPVVNGTVQALKIEPDGHILAGGQFTLVNGVERPLVVRLRPDGSIDEGFAPAGLLASDTFQGFARQDDGKLLLARSFRPPGGKLTHEVARLHADGSRDDAFECLLDEAVSAIVVQEDQRIFIAGSFSTVNGVTQRRLARLLSDGRLDTAFAPSVTSTVNALALEVSGSLIVETNLNTPSGLRSGLHWLGADGAPRDIFRARSKFQDTLALQSNGHLLAGGATESGFNSRGPGLIRVFNEPPSYSLDRLEDGRVLWRRAGSAPAAEAATLESSLDNGTTYGPTAVGVRIPGGWEFSPIGELTGRQVRLRARIASGWRHGSSGIAEWVTTLGSPEPALTIHQPAGVSVGLDDERAFPDTPLHEYSGLNFILLNTGTADLRFEAVAINGPEAASFILHPSLPPILAGPHGIGVCSISFNPTTLGRKSAQLHLLSSDPRVGSRTIRLTGNGVPPLGASDASLQAIQLDNGTLAPSFSAGIAAYAATLPHQNATLDLRAIPTKALSTVSIAGVSVTSQSNWTATVALVVGPNDIPIEVTAFDGTRQTYRLTLTRADQPGVGDVAALIPLPEYSYTSGTAALPGGRFLLRGSFPLDLSIDPFALLVCDPQGPVELPIGLPHLRPSGPMVVQPDGSILVGEVDADPTTGSYKWLDRILPDGTLDATFLPPSHPTVPATCKTILLQQDGSILITGRFPRSDGLPALNMVRLRSNGAYDATFAAAPFEPETESVESLVQQPDGRIVVGGTFSRIDGIERGRLARLHADGRLDSSFNPRITQGFRVSAMALQPDGKLIIGGQFSRLEPPGSATVERNSLARLHSDGSVDMSFDPRIENRVSSQLSIDSLALDSSGRLYLGGGFDHAGTLPRLNMARLLPDGSVDAAFNPHSTYSVNSMTLDGQGSLLVISYRIGGLATRGVARLHAGPAIDNLTTDGIGQVEWIREGSAPEADSVFVEAAAVPGGPFLPLGAASRTPQGWRLSGVLLPPGGQVRTRAHVRHASTPGSAGQIESVSAVGRLAVPVLQVSREGAPVSEGEVQAVDAVVGMGTERLFVLKNVGEATMPPLAVLIDGPDASEFSARNPVPPLAAGIATDFRLRFSPASPGLKRARLLISAPGLIPFELPILGTSTLSADAGLNNLAVRDWTIDPPYAPEITEYTVEVAHGTRQVHLLISPAHPTAQVRVDGALVTDPEAGLDRMVSGERQRIVIETTAPDGLSRRTFGLNIVRRLAPRPGDVDPSFAAQSDAIPHAALPLTDGGALIQEYLGDSRRYRFRRVTADGAPFPGFTPPEFPISGGGRLLMASHPDGGFLLAHSEVGNIDQTQGPFLVRLRPDGSLDEGFAHHLGQALRMPRVSCLAIEPDGSILLGGSFDGVSGLVRPGLARLNAQGRLDPSFAPVLTRSIFSNSVPAFAQCLAVQADGRILVSGNFTQVNGILRPQLARLERNGRLDIGFNARFPESPGSSIASIQPDAANRILLGGRSGSLMRHLPDGQADPTMPFSTRCDSFQPLVDGRTVLQGQPLLLDGLDGFGSLLRVQPDGQVDPAFIAAAFSYGRSPDSFSVYSDGRLLVTGGFERVGGEPRAGVARLLSGASSESLGVSQSGRIRWERRGEAPEAHFVTFAYSVDGGSTFTDLGLASRADGGWESSAALLPPVGQLRARARFASRASNTISYHSESLSSYSRPDGPPEKWRERHFGTWINAGPAADAADPDADGSVNLMEFASGSDPTRPGSPPLTLVPSSERPAFSLTFTRSREAMAAGLIWMVEWSDTLAQSPPWTSDGVVIEVVAESADTQVLIAHIPPSPENHRYARLKVNTPE